jgi:hypothetical protein
VEAAAAESLGKMKAGSVGNDIVVELGVVLIRIESVLSCSFFVIFY